MAPASLPAPKPGGGRFVEAIFNCRKPSIAAINGPAVGVGITMTLPMDVRIAARGAKIGFIFARRGLVPEAGSAWFLPKLVGLPQALRWCLSGRTFDADEARDGGLVSEVVEPAELLDRAKEIAREMTEATSAVSVALTRQMLWRFAGAPAPFELLDIDKPMSIERGGHADVREGVQAFLEKRPPSFPGKVSQDMPSQYPWWHDQDKAVKPSTAHHPQTFTRYRRPSDARPVLQHASDPQTRRRPPRAASSPRNRARRRKSAPRCWRPAATASMP